VKTKEAGVVSYNKPNLERILRDCAWMGHCQNDAASLTEPEWYAMLSIVGRCENGEYLVHDPSKPYRDYDRNKTTSKLKQAMESAGPRTCSGIEEIWGASLCEKCVYKRKITSPIQLGNQSSDDRNHNFFTEKGYFIPSNLGRAISERVTTIHDGQSFYTYQNGVYIRNGKNELQQMAQNLLGTRSRKNYIEEAVFWLKNNYYQSIKSINSNDGLINVSNGLLNWKTGELLPHTPERLSTIQIPVYYDPQATCEDIDTFISQVVPEDAVPIIYELFASSYE
jgi:hypothetical protein